MEILWFTIPIDSQAHNSSGSSKIFKSNNLYFLSAPLLHHQGWECFVYSWDSSGWIYPMLSKTPSVAQIGFAFLKVSEIFSFYEASLG